MSRSLETQGFAIQAPGTGTDDPQPSAANKLRDDAMQPDVLAARKAAAQAHQHRSLKNRNGSVVEVDGYGHVFKVDRPDGTGLDVTWNGDVATKIVERRKGGKNVEWNKDSNDDRWRSMDYIGAQRIAFRVSPDGSITYGGVDGTTFVEYGDGSQLRQTEKNTRIGIDPAGFITNIQRADGSNLTASYNNGKLDQIVETNNAQSVVWHRQPNDDWTSQQTPEVRHSWSLSTLGNSAYISSLNSNISHFQYLDGNTRDFEWNNGQISKVTETGPHSTVVWQRNGQTDEWISAQSKEVRTHVTAQPDGDYSYIDAKGFKHVNRFDDTEDRILPTQLTRSPAVETAYNDLVNDAGKRIFDATTLAKFKNDLDVFEMRAATQHLSEQQIIETYAQIDKLLEPPQNVQLKFGQADRTKLAEELLHHVAVPRSIDQGDHNTCGAAVTQVIVAERKPEKLASMIRQIADNGSFVTTSGATVALDSNSLQPDWQARNYDPYGNNFGSRSFASQLYQVGAINAAWKKLGYFDERYEQQRPNSPKDTGERLVQLSTGQGRDFTGLTDQQVESLASETAGIQLTILRHNNQFSNEQELSQKLEELQKNDRLPAVLWVHTKNEPFWSATGKGRGGGSPGGHYVTIWDVDSNGKVLVDNQWGRSGDYESLKRLSIHEAFVAGNP